MSGPVRVAIHSQMTQVEIKLTPQKNVKRAFNITLLTYSVFFNLWCLRYNFVQVIVGRIDINVAEVICAFAPFEQKCGTVVRISFYLEKILNPFPFWRAWGRQSECIVGETQSD